MTEAEAEACRLSFADTAQSPRVGPLSSLLGFGGLDFVDLHVFPSAYSEDHFGVKMHQLYEAEWSPQSINNWPIQLSGYTT
jgi:hypothetical protein